MVVDKGSLEQEIAREEGERRSGEGKEESEVNSILGDASNLAAEHGSRTKKGDVKSNYANSSSPAM